jgi:hypothetical protein
MFKRVRHCFVYEDMTQEAYQFSPKYNSNLIKTMQNENDNRQSSNNKKIVLVVLLYLCLTISNRYEQTNGVRYDNQRAIDILGNNNSSFKPTEMLTAL